MVARIWCDFSGSRWKTRLLLPKTRRFEQSDRRWRRGAALTVFATLPSFRRGVLNDRLFQSADAYWPSDCSRTATATGPFVEQQVLTGKAPLRGDWQGQPYHVAAMKDRDQQVAPALRPRSVHSFGKLLC